LLALLLGVKHSYDADHILAVSNLLTKTRSIKQTVKMSLAWATGHMMTAGVVTVFLYYGQSFLSSFLENFEVLVGIMLIALSIISFKNLGIFHKHEHTHSRTTHSHGHVHSTEEESHYHKHMFGIGIIQGLASNDELLLLFTVSLSITTLVGILMGTVIFSLGVIVGMIVYGSVMSFPLLKPRSKAIRKIVTISCGTISIVYGILLIVGVV
jgi:high-affinity nickel permease